MMTYKEALEFIHDLNRFGTKLGLNNILKLLELLDNPHKNINVIHVAGTNGKGSTSAMIDKILQEEGYKVGLFTSPYLEVFNERIRINGKNISDEDLARFTEKVQEAVNYMRQNNIGFPTEFEVVTAIGLLYFKEKNVDIIVLEVGMGGRLDATNVVIPKVSVITPIDLDHQQYLGDSIEKIAKEKCGIIKKGVPVVSAPQESKALKVIEKTAKDRCCPLIKVSRDQQNQHVDTISFKIVSEDIKGSFFDLKTPKDSYDNLRINLIGAHQVENAATAIGAIEVLKDSGIKVKKESIYKGLQNTKWAGRNELLQENPFVLIDGAHNMAGIRALKDTIEKHFVDFDKILVLGILEDKDYEQMVKEISLVADTIIVTKPLSPRALSATKLAKCILKHRNMKKVNVYKRSEINDAIDLAFDLSKKNDLIIFAGSIYLIGSVRSRFIHDKK